MESSLIIILLFVSCQDKEQKPAGILPKDEMVRVMIDMYVAEEKVNRLALNRDSAEKVFDIMETRVFEKTGVQDSVFRVSFDYYMDHPKELEEIYTALVDTLQLREQRTEQVK